MPDGAKATSVSYSWMALYNWCPRAFRYEKVDKVIPDWPQSIAAIHGRALHRVINAMYISRDFDLAYLRKIWPSIYSDQLQRDQFFFKDNKKETEWLNKGYKVLEQFHRLAQREELLVPPLKTEWKFRLDLGDISIVGGVDLIIKNSNRIRLLDSKMGLIQLEESELSEYDQLVIYSLATRRLLKVEEDIAGLIYPQHDKIVYAPRKYIEEDYEKLLGRIHNIINKVDSKKFDPTYKSCYMCRYNRRCKAEDLATKTGVDFRWLYETPAKRN